MSKTNKIFESIPVKIPGRSGFDLSHEVLTTAPVGTCVPISVTEVLPGDYHSIGNSFRVTLPPFAVPFMGRIDAEIASFFVPMRQLWQGWQSFITQNNGVSPSRAVGRSNVPSKVPMFKYDRLALRHPKYTARCSLMDYLGVAGELSFDDSSYNTAYLSLLPFLAYHKIVDEWYINREVCLPFFPKISPAGWTGSEPAAEVGFAMARLLPFISNPGNSSLSNYIGSICGEGYDSLVEKYDNLGWLSNVVDTSVNIFDLRQSQWEKDLFTTSTYEPQAGAESRVEIPTTGQNANSFSIAQLRAANSLQRWLERNNIAGVEYGAQILAHFGVTPPDTVLNRPILLGVNRTPVYVGSVECNADTSQIEGAGTRNPYGSVVGSAAGFGSSVGEGSLGEINAKEHGFIICMFRLVPHAYYNAGVHPEFLHSGYMDFAFPEFANIGDEGVPSVYVSDKGSISKDLPFGYNQRYFEYKMKLDRVCGKLAEGEDMSVYALKRSFSSSPELGKSFMEIPTNFLDQVYSVPASSGFGCMVDAFFNHKAVRVLPEYSLPSL